MPYTDGDHTRSYRTELKYICSEGELQQILARIRPLCQQDSHIASQGLYDIRSIYFDDAQNSCFYDNEDGNDPREKFRIRIYNASADRIALECKRKERSMTQKNICLLTMEQYQRIMTGTLDEAAADNSLLRKFYVQQNQNHLQPKVIVAYERTPFVYAPGNVRITFDRNIGSSSNLAGFFDPYLPLRPILPIGKHILEVKYDEFLPDFLYEVMSLGSIRQTTFSKYYLCRKFTA